MEPLLLPATILKLSLPLNICQPSFSLKQFYIIEKLQVKQGPCQQEVQNNNNNIVLHLKMKLNFHFPLCKTDLKFSIRGFPVKQVGDSTIVIRVWIHSFYNCYRCSWWGIFSYGQIRGSVDKNGVVVILIYHLLIKEKKYMSRFNHILNIKE